METAGIWLRCGLVSLLTALLAVVCWGDGRGRHFVHLAHDSHDRATPQGSPRRSGARVPSAAARRCDVLWHLPHGDLFVQDGTGAVFVVPVGNPPALRPGDVVEVEGVSRPSDFMAGGRGCQDSCFIGGPPTAGAKGFGRGTGLGHARLPARGSGRGGAVGRELPEWLDAGHCSGGSPVQKRTFRM